MSDLSTDPQAPASAPSAPAAPARRRWRLNSRSPIMITFYALILGLVVGALVIITTTPAVLDSWRGIFHSGTGIFRALKVTWDNVGAAYRSMFNGAVVNPANLWHSITTGQGWEATLTPLSETLTYATPLIITSLGVGIAFQTGLFNIGANGQAVLGGVTGAVVGSMVHVPMIVHLPLTLVCGFAGGALAGLVPGFLKAYTGAHEVIVTIMFNYVIYAFLLFSVLSTPFQQPGQQNDISRTMDSSAQLHPLFGAASGLRVNYGIVVAALAVAFAWWFLERSSMGFDFRVTGANPAAAKASGINAKVVIILVFVISGGLSGLAGVVQVASTTHYIDGGFLIGSAGIGFTAITVALLGRNKPGGIVWASLLFAALGVGGRAMQGTTGIPLDLASVIQSAIVLFVATPVLVKEIFRLRAAPVVKLELATKGWGA
ncbi:MAG: ABC transporter permease [Acidobacteriota bacterium]|nr:ABC transporter permease [Acidobacteriota bacterium]